MTFFWQDGRVTVNDLTHPLHGLSGRVVRIEPDDRALVFFDKPIPNEHRTPHRGQRLNCAWLRPQNCTPEHPAKTT